MTLGPGTARLLLVPILLAYGYIAVGYARATPRWNNPDEPAHVNVVRQIATTGTLPVLSEGDWDSELLARLTTAWFPNDYEVDGIRYEGHQPPLYYLLAAPVYRLGLWLGLPLNRQIVLLRLLSVALGAVTILAAFVAAREAAKDRPALAVLAAATVAFVPMNTAISAAVNNDALANALAAVTLAALMAGRRRGPSDRWAIGLGVLIGLLVLTKLTVYVYVPLILATLLLADRPSESSLPGWLRALRRPAIAAGVGLLVSGWWLIRNMLVYGWLDPLAMTRHDQIVVGQPRWAGLDLESLDFFLRIVFRSFWGMFGWMGVVLDDGFYILYLVLMVLAIVGVVLGRFTPHPPPPSPDAGDAAQRRGPAFVNRGRGGADGHLLPHQATSREKAQQDSPRVFPPPHSQSQEGSSRLPLARVRGMRGLRSLEWAGGEGFPLAAGQGQSGLLLAAALLVIGEVAYYNLTFIQPQGRYLFPALVPIAVFLASGWWQLASRAADGPLGRLLTAGSLAGAIAWGLGEAHGSLWAEDLWSDNALMVAAAVGALLMLVAPRTVRARLPDGLCLSLALTLALLDLAALVKFVAPAFPAR